jgi:hypothetical protein
MTKQQRFNYEAQKEGNSLISEEEEEDLLG